MAPDRRRTNIPMAPWADRRRNQAWDIAGLFVDGPAAETWAALNSQPVAALVKPPSPDDDQVPVIDFESVRADQDLDAIASAFARDDDNSSSD